MCFSFEKSIYLYDFGVNEQTRFHESIFKNRERVEGRKMVVHRTLMVCASLLELVFCKIDHSIKTVELEQFEAMVATREFGPLLFDESDWMRSRKCRSFPMQAIQESV